MKINLQLTNEGLETGALTSTCLHDLQHRRVALFLLMIPQNHHFVPPTSSKNIVKLNKTTEQKISRQTYETS